MKRSSKDYLDRKQAWELAQTPAWNDLLKPMLEATAKRMDVVTVSSLDSAFQAARSQAEAGYAKSFIQRIERLAKEFPTVQVTGD